MKNYAVVIFIFSGSILNCSKERGTSNEDFDFHKFCLTAGSWTIAQYISDNMEYTENYVEYVLKFEENGNIVVTNNTGATSGSWAITYTGGEVSLEFNFDGPNDFQMLNAKWSYLENGPDAIGLHINYTKFLKFSK